MFSTTLDSMSRSLRGIPWVFGFMTICCVGSRAAAESDKLQVEIQFQLEEALPGILDSMPERVIGSDGSVVLRGDARNSPELASGALWVAKRSMITTQTDEAFWQSVKVGLVITKDALTHIYGVKYADVAIEMLVAAIESESKEDFCWKFLEWLAEQGAKGALKTGAAEVGEAAEDIVDSFVVDKGVSKANEALFKALLEGKRERITIVAPDVPGYEGSIHGDYGLELRSDGPRLILNMAGVGRRELRGGVHLGDFHVRGEFRLAPKITRNGDRVAIVYALRKPGTWMVDARFAREDEEGDEPSDDSENDPAEAEEETSPRPLDPCRGSRDLHKYYTMKAKPLREELGRVRREMDSVFKQLVESRSRLERAGEQLIPVRKAEIRRGEEKLDGLRINARSLQYRLDGAEARAEAARIAHEKCLARGTADDKKPVDLNGRWTYSVYRYGSHGVSFIEHSGNKVTITSTWNGSPGPGREPLPGPHTRVECTLNGRVLKGRWHALKAYEDQLKEGAYRAEVSEDGNSIRVVNTEDTTDESTHNFNGTTMIRSREDESQPTQWTYGSRADLKGSDFQPFDQPIGASVPGMAGWGRGGIPYVIWNPTDAPIRHGGTILPVGCVVLHPSSGGEYSILRYTALEPEKKTFQGEFYDMPQAGDWPDDASATVDVFILANGKPVFRGALNKNRKRLPFQILLDLQIRDTVEFAVGVGSNGTYDYDHTGLHLNWDIR